MRGHKTKAALQGRQCHYIESKQSQTITSIDRVNLTEDGIPPSDFGSFNYVSGIQLAFYQPFGSMLEQSTILNGSLSLGAWQSLDSPEAKPLIQIIALLALYKANTATKIQSAFFTIDIAPFNNQPFGSIPNLSNSRRANSFNQFPRLTPSRIAAWFSCSRNSGVIRIWKVGDSPSPFGVLSLLIVDMYVRNPIVWILLCTYVITVYVKIATPRECLQPLPRRLTKPLIEVTIMADTQSTQTRPKYHFRFLALDRANRKAAPCCISVDASSECEARRVLAPYFILSLAARLPVCGGHRPVVSTIAKIAIVQEVRNA